MSAIELELFRQMLGSIADEMGIVLRKTAYSSNIKERRDYSCAVYDRAGQTVAMGEHMPVHLGAMPLSVEHARRGIPIRARRCRRPQRSLSGRDAPAGYHCCFGSVSSKATSARLSMSPIARITRTSAA